jgi:alpha-mannosidase
MADRGQHRFTYAVYPHSGDWRTAQTPNAAIAFNTPLRSVLGQPPTTMPSDHAPSTVPAAALAQPSTIGTFLDWHTPGTHLAALKPAEDEPDQYILRFWDLYGTGTELDPGKSTITRTDLLETAIASESPTHIAPWQIATFKTSSFINKSLRNHGAS